MLPLILLLLLTTPAFSQSRPCTIEQLRQELRQCPQKTGSTYYAYPAVPQREYTPVPPGFEPVYISHYGRHGSRWVTEDRRYLYVLNALDSAQLTPLGQELRRRLEPVWLDAQGRGGELTQLGERQHHDIAQRMARRCPTLFGNGAHIRAHSSTVRRCMMSMMAFAEGLKELEPTLQIERSACERDMQFVCYDSPELKAYTAEWKASVFAPYRSATIRPQRLMASLFTHPEAVADPLTLTEELYWIAQNMQDVELGIDLYDIFTPDELFDIWRTVNCRMYATCAAPPFAHSIPAASADGLLRHIVECADEALATHGVTATLRFGHDSALLRLLTRMSIDGCADSTDTLDSIPTVWQDFRLVPMAANLQLTFYQSADGEVLVGLLLNEREATLPINTDTPPYYPWIAVKRFWGMGD